MIGLFDNVKSLLLESKEWQTLITGILAFIAGAFVLRAAKIQSRTDLIRLEHEIGLRKKSFYTLSYLEFSEFRSEAVILRDEVQGVIDSQNFNINLRREIALLSLPHTSTFIEESFRHQIDIDPALIEKIWEFNIYKRKMENFADQLKAGAGSERRDSIPLLKTVIPDDSVVELAEGFKFFVATLEAAIDTAEQVCLHLQPYVEVRSRGFF